MNVFDLRQRLVSDYARYTKSFIKIADPTILAKVDSELDAGAFWPEPLLQLNPTFQPGGTIDDLVADGNLHRECARIFRIDKTKTDLAGKQLFLHTHQTEGIRKAKENKSYVLTSGTGSGKSLTYIVPIVDHVLRHGSGQGDRGLSHERPGQQPGRGAWQVPETRIPGREAPSSFRPLHRSGERAGA